MQVPQLKRGLFGYTPESVRLLLADRDKMFLRASENARAAEALVLELRAEVESVKAELFERSEKLRAAEAEAADLRTDRDATGEELESCASEVQRLSEEVQSLRLQVADAEELMRVADAQIARHAGDLSLIRRELGSARREFLVQNQRARSAESRIEELEAELTSTRDELEAELNHVGEELGVAKEEATDAPAEAATVSKELSEIVEAAEHTLARVLDSGRARAAAELRDSERTRREMREEVERLAEWRERLAPLVAAVRASIDETQLRASRFGEALREAVEPVTQAIDVLGDRLAVLAELSGPSSSSQDGDEPEVQVVDLQDHENEDAAPQEDRSGDGTPAGWGWR
jgi:chromosome segregation ATPase